MASIRKHPKSKYWFACITLPDGRQTQRSTKQTNAKLALGIAEKLEAARRAKLTERQARKIVADIYEMVKGERLTGSSSRAFFTRWAANKERETAASTAKKYRDFTKQFLASLGGKANDDVSDITPADVTAFRDELADRLSPASADLGVKIVRMALKQAVVEKLADSNAAFGLKRVKNRGAVNSRRAFTIPELKAVLDKASDEWRGLILFGLYTGQRLGDLARLTWQNLDLEADELRFVTSKTGRRQRIPLAKPLRNLIETLDAGDDPKAPLFPRAAATGRVGTLSNRFYQILTDVGLVHARTHQAKAQGRGSKRAFNELGFHALRHTATSLMKNAGISPAIVQDIIGHDSPAMSAHYTHIEGEAKRRAIDSMPDVMTRR